MHTSQHTATSHMKKQGNMAQSKEQNKSPETKLQITKIDEFEFPNKEFNITIIMIFNKLRKMIHEQNENINKRQITVKKKTSQKSGAEGPKK